MTPEEARILCIGGANIDRKLRTLGPLRMASSNPAEQVRESFGGVARNVAENLARRGIATRLLTAVGDDGAGRALLAHAEAAGLSTEGSLVVPGAPTGSYTAVLDEAGQMLLGLAAMPLAERLTPERVLGQGAALTVVDLNLPAASVAALIDEARATGRPLVAVAVSEPKMDRLPLDLRGLHCLILNRGELSALGGDLVELHRRGVAQIALTQGPDGVICSRAGAAPEHLPAPPVERIVDVTGAGDAFAAGVCAGLLDRPQDLAAACRLGLEMAALTLQTDATVATIAP